MISKYFPVVKRAKLGDEEEKEDKATALGNPFCAPAPNKYRCRFQSTCEECFLTSQACKHFKPVRLKLLLVGINPSTHVWLHGFNYGNPTNRMWKLLTGQLGGVEFDGLLPKSLDVTAQNELPSQYQIGFADIGLLPENDAAKVDVKPWIASFYARLARHVKDVQLAEGTDEYKGPNCLAFTGKGQFQALYPGGVKQLEFGVLGDRVAWPANFPISRAHTKIFILPSSSGRAVMTHAERIAPYSALAQFVKEMQDS